MGARILIIEDNPANLELTTYLLGAFGHTVFTAENGNEGLQRAALQVPDLIICDIQLPDIDGFEIARRLRNNPPLSSVPLIGLTALAMVGDRDRVLAAGFDGYLAKPIDPETFVSQIEAYLPRETHSLPLIRLDTRLGASAAPAIAPPSRGITILVVDNLPVNLELARGILEPSGYNVITAGNIVEGLGLARRFQCHLILSDMRMPEGSGYEFLQMVKADPRLRAVPFLIVSSLMTDKDRIKGLDMGAARYFFRPVEPEALLAEIRTCLAEKESIEDVDDSHCR